MFLGKLAVMLLGSMLAGKSKLPRWEVIRASKGTITATEAVIREGQEF